jgi:predicted DNA binding CopG/RHH family protein
MKKYAKSLKEYENIEVDEKKLMAIAKRLKKGKKFPTSVALEEGTVKDLKKLSQKKGVPYQILMRMFILEGLEKMKKRA